MHSHWVRRVVTQIKRNKLLNSNYVHFFKFVVNKTPLMTELKFKVLKSIRKREEKKGIVRGRKGERERDRCY